MEAQYIIKAETNIVKGNIYLPSSKSESNRALILKQLYGPNLAIRNLSEANDTRILQECLSKINTSRDFNVHDAGTAMRFLTALFAVTPGERVLSGTNRMHERPIKSLVEALTQLGAHIEYLKEAGFPPLRIVGKQWKGGEVELNEIMSSQFVTALILIAPFLPNGLKIKLNAGTVSDSYIQMTLDMLKGIGVDCKRTESVIEIKRFDHTEKKVELEIEADWSASSYWYSIAALSDRAEINLIGLREQSSQGDKVVADLFKQFGVETTYTNEGVSICKNNLATPTFFEFNFSSCPDLAQTLAVTCSALGVKARLTGLQTLVSKETDRLTALKNELFKINTLVQIIDSKELVIYPDSLNNLTSLHFKSYNDHRMVMSFAPLVFNYKQIEFDEIECVKKSYPGFWKDISCFVNEVNLSTQ